jgi:DNA-binding NtrC family response regulator
MREQRGNAMKKQILIVDDESEIREMLSRHFRFAGYEVESAANGKQALEILSRIPIKVVISDIKMPEMDGISMLAEIRDHYPMIRAIMITGYVTLENALACMRNQADTVIFKPLNDLTELDAAVVKAFEKLKHWESKFLTLRGMKSMATPI